MELLATITRHNRATSFTVDIQLRDCSATKQHSATKHVMNDTELLTDHVTSCTQLPSQYSNINTLQMISHVSHNEPYDNDDDRDDNNKKA